MTRVVFVDDDRMVLSGLRRMLRASRSEFEMKFASSGEDVLALLQDSPFDVIVSDIRMPEMSGTELLAKVKERFPQMVRIVLSGYCEEEGILQTIGPHHHLIIICNRI